MTLEQLVRRIRQKAESADFSLDGEVYARAGRDPLEPILYAGSLDSPLAFFARDLGRDEVLEGEPLIGGAGRRVRSALFSRQFGRPAPVADRRLEGVLGQVLLTNTVPYKPVGNRAYPGSVKERFRPEIAALLVCLWRGDRIVTLGREAFLWFEPYCQGESAGSFWARENRFEATLECTMRADCDGRTVEKRVTLAPLPHPSPLNQAYLAAFPALLDARLALFAPAISHPQTL